MVFLDSIDDISTGSMTVTIIVQEGVPLPSIGETIVENGTELYITKVDPKSREVSAIMRKNLNKDEMLMTLRIVASVLLEDIASYLYTLDNEGSFSSLISWEDVSAEVKDKYILCAKNIFKLFSKSGLVSLDLKKDLGIE